MKNLFNSYIYATSHLYDVLIFAWQIRGRGERVPPEVLKRIKDLSEETDRLRDLCLSSRLQIRPK